jgi:hypothetical protein
MPVNFYQTKQRHISENGTLNNEGLHKLYFTTNIINMIKSRRIIWEDIYHAREIKDMYIHNFGHIFERERSLEDLGLDSIIMLTGIIQNYTYSGRVLTKFIWPEQGPVAASCLHSNEHSSYKRRGIS